MRETCFLITRDEQILRIYTGSATRIDDSLPRWKAIWTYRYEIEEIVHTHPGGFLRFSDEDLTTMQAVEAATGCQYIWSIATEDSYLRRLGHDGVDTSINGGGNTWWLNPLRDLSFGNNVAEKKLTVIPPISQVEPLCHN